LEKDLTEVIDNRQVGGAYHILTLSYKGKKPAPGQFYMIRCGDTFEPLLRRPFSFFSEKEGIIKILYKVVGRGTSILSRKKSGDSINILGPLGNGYPIKPKTPSVIVAGGMGIASLYPLIERLGREAKVIYGARTSKELLFIDELRGLAGQLILSTDDGSYGHKGSVLSIVEGLSEDRIIYACGPSAMLKGLSDIAKRKSLRAYISLEENMACGIGACLGCAVKTIRGYERVCKEGPVFFAGDIVFES